MKFEVDNVALGQVFVRALRFPLPVSFQPRYKGIWGCGGVIPHKHTHIINVATGWRMISFEPLSLYYRVFYYYM
jgi:hypothetical protein